MTAVSEWVVPDRRLVSEVADNFIALMRTFGKARARIMADAEHDVEWSSRVLLKCLKNEGPKRAGELAGVVHSDASTVSRQVTTLVRDGLLQRRADPLDGRASLLVLTPQAEAVLDDHDRVRLDHFAAALHDWEPADLEQFADLLGRFTTAYDQMNAEWLAERMAARPAPAFGTAPHTAPEIEESDRS